MQKNIMQKKAYSIGEISTLSGVKVPTIRFYEQTGLLEAPPRSSGNRREYGEPALERLRFIRHARELGFDTADIRELLELAGQPNQPCHRADEIAVRHLEQVERRIAQLQALRQELQHMIGQCDHSRVRQCRIIGILADHEQCLHSSHDATAEHSALEHSALTKIS